MVEKPLGALTQDDWVGHETFENQQEMYATYRNYYGPQVNAEIIVKILWFKADLDYLG